MEDAEYGRNDRTITAALWCNNCVNSEFFFAGVPADALLAYTNGKEMSISPRKMFDVFQALRRTSRQYRRTDIREPETNGQEHEEDGVAAQ